MPWIKKDLCIACGICIRECPVQAISKEEKSARIDEDKCIRCGRCHELCPHEAVRHDGERVPDEIQANLRRTQRLSDFYHTAGEKQKLLERMIRYFNKEKKVAEQTVILLQAMRDDSLLTID